MKKQPAQQKNKTKHCEITKLFIKEALYFVFMKANKMAK